MRSSLASAALASSASFKPVTASSPQRVVIFIKVVGCGTRVPNGIRQNRCQEIESDTSRHSDSKPSRYRNFKNINRRYVSIGIDGRPIRASKYAANGAKNTGSSSSASTRSSSTGKINNSGGRIESHNVGCSFTVLNTMASIPSSPRG